MPIFSGTENSDFVLGSALADIINAGKGEDTVRASDGNDRIFGQEDADFLFGENGNDTIESGDGDDVVDGGDGSDFLDGGAGADRLIGGFGSDTITGGFGVDTLVGKQDQDFFLLQNTQAHRDVIVDFVSGEDDLMIDSAIFGGGFNGSSLDPSQLVVGVAPTATQAGIGQFLFDTVTGRLSWDVDGAGGAAPLWIATLQGVTSLSASDFEVF